MKLFALMLPCIFLISYYVFGLNPDLDNIPMSRDGGCIASYSLKDWQKKDPKILNWGSGFSADPKIIQASLDEECQSKQPKQMIYDGREYLFDGYRYNELFIRKRAR